MRFVLYNIRYGTGGVPGRGPLQFFRPSSEQLQRIVKFIRSVHPDVVGLIEVDAGSYRSRRMNQARVIAEALGHCHAYASKYGADSMVSRLPIFRNQGNAFVVRDSQQEVRCHFFRKGIKRLVLELELPEVVIFLVHLALRARVRSHQLRDLYDLVRRARKPVLVAGDFNAWWGPHETFLFQEALGLRNADPHGRPTFPSWKPRRQLDLLLHDPNIVVDRFEVPNVVLSDHLPVICDFHVRPVVRPGVRAKPRYGMAGSGIAL